MQLVKYVVDWAQYLTSIAGSDILLAPMLLFVFTMAASKLFKIRRS